MKPSSIKMNPLRLKERLKESGLSYSRFEALSGVSISTLKRAISGDMLRPSTAAIIATALGTTVEWLTGTDDEPTEPEIIVAEPEISQAAENEPKLEPEVSQPAALDIHFLIANMTSSYDRALATKDEVIRQKNRWISVLAVALGAVILSAILLLGYDIANANIGWVQY
jgi:transcriptional regulator with XRE-family HTH domain